MLKRRKELSPQAIPNCLSTGLEIQVQSVDPVGNNKDEQANNEPGLERLTRELPKRIRTFERIAQQPKKSNNNRDVKRDGPPMHVKRRAEMTLEKLDGRASHAATGTGIACYIFKQAKRIMVIGIGKRRKP